MAHVANSTPAVLDWETVGAGVVPVAGAAALAAMRHYVGLEAAPKYSDYANPAANPLQAEVAGSGGRSAAASELSSVVAAAERGTHVAPAQLEPV